jgi:hypothetical protein
MRRIASCVALTGLVVLVACSLGPGVQLQVRLQLPVPGLQRHAVLVDSGVGLRVRRRHMEGQMLAI